MSASLGEILDEVNDRETFLAFVAALVADREEAAKLEREKPEYYSLGGANGWQNGTIEGFLDAALACFDADANRGRADNSAAENAWKLCAEFLFCGKIYE